MGGVLLKRATTTRWEAGSGRDAGPNWVGREFRCSVSKRERRIASAEAGT